MTHALIREDRRVSASERWEALPGSSGYDVSADGRVRSYHAPGRAPMRSRARVLRPSINKDGYLQVTLVGRGAALVHRLVLETFSGPCPDGAEGCHFPDRTKANCRASNLRWDTSAANVADREFHGTTARGDRSGARRHPETHVRGERSPFAKLTDAKVADVRRRVRAGESYAHLSRELGVSEPVIKHAANGKLWSHVGEPPAAAVGSHLAAADVYAIRRRFDARKRWDRHNSIASIARDFSVSPTQIFMIGRRKSWKHLPEEVLS